MAEQKAADKPSGFRKAVSSRSVVQYDRVASLLTALVILVAVPVIWLGGVWLTNQVFATQVAAPVELIEVAGGEATGSLDETLRMDADVEEISELAAPEEVESEEIEAEHVPAQVLEAIAEVASDLADPQEVDDLKNRGRRARAEGTGQRGRGFGPGAAGLPREMRWEIVYDQQQTLDEYARQLDYFSIELGAVLGANRLVYLSNLSATTPTKREVVETSDQRLYLLWQGGSRREADLRLLRKSGIEVPTGIVMQFVPPDTENQMARLEQGYANRKVSEIQRTRFGIRRVGDGYELYVIDQQYFK